MSQNVQKYWNKKALNLWNFLISVYNGCKDFEIFRQILVFFLWNVRMFLGNILIKLQWLKRKCVNFYETAFINAKIFWCFCLEHKIFLSIDNIAGPFVKMFDILLCNVFLSFKTIVISDFILSGLQHNLHNLDLIVWKVLFMKL